MLKRVTVALIDASSSSTTPVAHTRKPFFFSAWRGVRARVNARATSSPTPFFFSAWSGVGVGRSRLLCPLHQSHAARRLEGLRLLRLGCAGLGGAMAGGSGLGLGLGLGLRLGLGLG